VSPILAILLEQLEDTFAEPLPALPPAEQRELEALLHLSTEALWTIARERMPEDTQARMQTLMAANTQGTLDDAQQSELQLLVEQEQHLGLRRAQAAALLTERGYTVTLDRLASTDG
jgi:hypothetical protein